MKRVESGRRHVLRADEVKHPSHRSGGPKNARKSLGMLAVDVHPRPSIRRSCPRCLHFSPSLPSPTYSSSAKPRAFDVLHLHLHRRARPISKAQYERYAGRRSSGGRSSSRTNDAVDPADEEVWPQPQLGSTAAPTWSRRIAGASSTQRVRSRTMEE